MIVWVILAIVTFSGFALLCSYCFQGSKCGKDVIILMLHRFPEPNQAREFRKQIVVPLIKRFGGQVEFSGQVVVTYTGNEVWDSILFAYFPSHGQAQSAMTEVLKKERSFSQHLQNSNSSGKKIIYLLGKNGTKTKFFFYFFCFFFKFLKATNQIIASKDSTSQSLHNLRLQIFY